ncbi:MAG: uL30 family ribosomal protein, partial [Candidatus Micrarchaeaceae archaeon]
MDESKVMLAIRVRGRAGVRQEIKETLNRLNLKRVNNLVLLPINPSTMGMLKKSKDYITYGEANLKDVAEILEKKGIAIKEEELREISSGKKKAREALSIPIRLRPPKRGYKGVKVPFSRHGALGYRGEKIIELLRRMV